MIGLPAILMSAACQCNICGSAGLVSPAVSAGVSLLVD